MPGVALVCFDLGGVLVRICRDWAEGCRAAGLTVRGASGGSAAGLIRGKLMRELGSGRLSEAQWAEQLSAALSGVQR